jgi:hypothetical protein
MMREIRHARLRDIPLLMRLNESCTILDSELGFTRDVIDPFSGVVIPRGLYTLVARADDLHAAGQFRMQHEGHHAHLVQISHLAHEDAETVWLHLLDGLTEEAGKRGAHELIGEIAEDHPLFEAMRRAGFALYARQEIWRAEHLLTEGPAAQPLDGVLEPMAHVDIPSVQALHLNNTPRMVQRLTDWHSEGLVYRRDDRIVAYVGIARGKLGVYLMPCIAPNAQALPILRMAALKARGNQHDLPIYVRVRRYQLWLETALETLGFEAHAQQAVMVRHIAAMIRPQAVSSPQFAFDTLFKALDPALEPYETDELEAVSLPEP